MQRSWVLLPVAVSALLISQLSPPAVPTGYVDPVALATAAASWHCLLPHRPRRVQLRAAGAPPLLVTAGRQTDGPDGPGGPGGPSGPGGPDERGGPGEPGRPQPIPGLGTGPGRNPRARIDRELTAGADAQSFQVPMRAGEVLGVTLTGAAKRLEVRDPSGTLVEGSETDRSSAYPESSPLPGGGNATVDHVAAVTGTHVLTVRNGTGAYQATLSLAAPPATAPQRIYLDFAGGPVDTRIFGQDSGAVQPRALSPLRSFLPAWGLRDSDEPALIGQITDTVAARLRATGGITAVEVTNSVSSPNLWGQPGVSRVVIGGTAAQTGLDTVGISQSVDPGNFDRAETALVLLDNLSGPAEQAMSLNHYLPAGANRVEFIAAAVGNIAAHEAGHFLGSWHTDPHSGRHDLMAPGDVVGAFGYGPDGVGGTADDTRPAFGQDAFDPAEGLAGLEDTRNRTRIGLDGRTPPSPG